MKLLEEMFEYWIWGTNIDVRAEGNMSGAAFL
jgi:hypothetical protein